MKYLLLVVFLLQSCASIFNGTRERVSFQSDIKGTKFYMDDEYLGTDVASIRVKKKKFKKVTFYAKKEGCATRQLNVETTFDATTLLGLLIDFGLVSILVIDWGINGATQSPDRVNYVLSPECS